MELCRHPECNMAGQSSFTEEVLCDNCKNRVKNLLDDLATDFARLTLFPSPLKSIKVKIRNSASNYGHPAEWASDMLTRVSESLYGWWDCLAEELSLPQPTGAMRESAKTKIAISKLDIHLPQLVAQEWIGVAIDEWLSLHRQISSALGYTRPREWLPVPCWGCNSIGLRLDSSRDQIHCPYCGWILREEHWGLYERMILDNKEKESLHQVDAVSQTHDNNYSTQTVSTH